MNIYISYPVDCGPGEFVDSTDPDNPQCIDCPVGTYQPVRDPTNHTCIECEMMGGLKTSTLEPGSGKLASDCIRECMTLPMTEIESILAIVCSFIQREQNIPVLCSMQNFKMRHNLQKTV